MRVTFGLIFLLLGGYLIKYAIADHPVGASFLYLAGYYLPSSLIALFGVLLLSWTKK